MIRGQQVGLNRPWLFDQLRERYEHPLEVRAYERQVARGLLREERAILERTFAVPSRLLDLGCGAGREAFALEAMGHEVVAADISREMIKAAKRIASKRDSSVTWVTMQSPLEIPLPAGSFDGIVALAQLLSHIPGSDARIALLGEVRRVLRPGGAFLASFTTRSAIREFARGSRGFSNGGRRSDTRHQPTGDDHTSSRVNPSATANTFTTRPDLAPTASNLAVTFAGVAHSAAELDAGWESGDIFVWDPSEAKLDEPLFFHLHTEEEIASELTAAGLELEAIVDARTLTEKAAWDAHRYPFLVARSP